MTDYSYSIPEYTDDEGQEVTLQVTGLDESFMAYDEGKVTLTNVTEQNAGNYSLTITLSDTYNATNSYQL